MTERLYYTDPYLQVFQAEILAIEITPDGRQGAILDRTAFYPTSGGQPYDLGTLGSARVTDVVDRDDGTILHVFEGELACGRIEARIDWTRRFDHMQQHTGQHVLSAAFDRVGQARTESFHLGASSATIDLAKELPPEEIRRAEAEANRVVWEDRPVTIRFVSAEEAIALPLRKEPVRAGELRLIDVEGFDLSACGGTHVRRTGAIGIIAIGSWERFRGGTRVEFRCGGRALHAYHHLRDIMGEATRLLSVLPAEVAPGIERLQAEAREIKRENKGLQARLASFEADALTTKAEPVRGVSVVVAQLDGWDANGLKSIASHIATRPKHAAVLIGMPVPAAVVAARAADVSLDCGAIVKQLAARFGGKGGGRPELSQGGGLHGDGPAIVEFARTLVSGA